MVQFIKMATSRYTITIYSHNQDIQYALNDQKEFEEFQLSTTALRGMHKNYSVSPDQHAHPLLCSFSGTAASGIPWKYLQLKLKQRVMKSAKRLSARIKLEIKFLCLELSKKWIFNIMLYFQFHPYNTVSLTLNNWKIYLHPPLFNNTVRDSSTCVM